ncbi:BolA family transcriptional regulator [Roseobacter denitrificans]|uniref:BolA protein n=1 Tax=Roseobacter denitrificans (strain ATCC 33942 / OCh 114) TaxID=375451 RepID=Q163K7_ROSDO|nr:BolA family protein [Roseobacter denitrificans]ABG32836.1 BolA protein [Roseobacter denitrificans OCh 114]AVL52236.1 BolA family transcriptional regulator [Roseobacter denitrificans]SFF95538.1 transcriptional regulator, BolA protein family [Roseobacter denitrificans OCh 114]
MSKRQDIEDSLQQAFAPRLLEVVDDTESHRGHAGFTEGVESHFNVMIRSDHFAGMNRIQRHRAIHGALGPELIAQIHALALDVNV